LPRGDPIGCNVATDQGAEVEELRHLDGFRDLLGDRAQAVPPERLSARAGVLVPPVLEQARPVRSDESLSAVSDETGEMTRRVGNRLLTGASRARDRRLPHRLCYQDEEALHRPAHPGMPARGCTS